MADRHAQILVLLRTRYDHLPEPVRHTHTMAGFVGRDDPYAVKRVQPYGLDGSRHEHARAIDAAISVAERELRRFPGFRPVTSRDEIADADQHPDGWEIARRRMYAEFDYRALDVALEKLRAGWPGLAASSPRGLAILEQWMPDPIRAPPPAAVVNAAASGRWADPRARAQRDRQVRAWARAGRPLGEIAAELALSWRQVRRIVNGDEQAA